ncbi:MAG: DUF1036 domain-containing protein [Rhizomicrobium sp.]
MRLFSRLLAVVTLALGCATLASPAQAAMNLCNRTSYVLYAATGAATGGGVNAQGWTRVAPGACRVVVAGDLAAASYYLYARSSQAHSGPTRAWGGDVQICVKDTNFTNRDAANAPVCQSDDFFQLPFATVDTHHLKSWTATFSESPALATLPQAQMAGLKRLLRDAGYRIGALDARPDKAADGALADFRKKLRMAPAASVGDVFDALETEALKTATPAGYAICNDTAKSVAAALGQRARNDWISHGWWKIAAGSCAKVMDDLRGVDSVFLFVTRINGPALVTGPAKFCTADIEFDIQSRTRCKERGLADTGFLETRVNGLNGYAAHVGENGLVRPGPKRR